jgi:diguanylate cyclase (GGDEF)-like protein
MTRRAEDAIPVTTSRLGEVWSLPRRLLAVVLTVDGVAIVGTALVMFRHIERVDVIRFAVLAALGVAYVEISHRLTRQRFLFNESAPHTNLSSVWTLAGTLVLPLNLAALLAIVTHIYLWRRVWSHLGASKLYRVVYSCASVTISCLVSGTLLTAVHSQHGQMPPDLRSALHVVLVTAAYFVTSFVLIASAVLSMAGRAGIKSALPTRSHLSLEATAVLLGAVTAVLAVHQPWFVAMVAPILLVFERATHTQHFQQAASIDAKTGLLNATAWQILATRSLKATIDAGKTAGVLIIDLDHFKKVNDGFGHLAGDKVLSDVAAALTAELRGYDLIGRFGGEEFVVFLPGVDQAGALEIAERVRRCVHTVEISAPHRDGQTVPKVTASVGMAAHPEHGEELADLLQAADFALYHAKESGRDGVKTAVGVGGLTAGVRSLV